MTLTDEQQGMLDELVADVFDSKRSEVNNSGPDYQVAFLISEGWSVLQIVRALSTT